MSKRSITLIVIGAIALVLAFPFWFSGLGFIAFLDSIVHHLAYVVAVLLIVGAILASLFFWERVKRPLLLAIGGGIAVIAGIGIFVTSGYGTATQYASAVTEVDEPVNYADRAPWVVSDSYSNRDQGDIVGDRVGVHYVPASKDSDAADGAGTSRYTTLIDGRAPIGLHGYEGIQTLNMPTTGTIPSDASSYCEMPEGMNDRLGAFWPGHNLNWNINAKKPNAHWNKDDAYGYCDGDDPVVVVPLWKYEGFWLPTKTPDGAAVYKDGNVTLMDSEKLAEEKIQGPTYPTSVAEAQRKSINAGGSLFDWWGYRYGYDTTEKDDEDTNEGATTEFTLITADGEMQYVTPLTPRGTSQSMTAVSYVPAVQTKEGRQPIVVNTNPDLKSTSTIATTIKESSVNGDNAWTTRWASGMTIYEVLPAQEGHWAASIGQGQAVSYRADIDPDGKITVTNSDTGQSSDKDSEEAEESVTVDGGKPLSEMTDEEVYDLIHEATDELEKRNSSTE